MGKKPLVMVMKHVDKLVRVKLKNELVYEGKMIECDSYMNIVIEKAVEYEGNGRKAQYPRILIRGNNIMYIQLKPELAEL
ncbi:MAG: ribonucleoprotein [Thaumarchaeota archaeon]|nr:ribonucleoprotein [Nitrososphaerota archaeon]RLG05222.1 MAG: ribonucleoprotein [Nitrososphaerota archaeon]HDD43034.1 ribonucleoprotein [Nitrososphaeria archaeon]